LFRYPRSAIRYPQEAESQQSALSAIRDPVRPAIRYPPEARSGAKSAIATAVRKAAMQPLKHHSNSFQLICEVAGRFGSHQACLS
jgi:hypothetical protein